MKTHVASTGIVTPLTDEIAELRELITSDMPPKPALIENPFSKKRFPVRKVADRFLKSVSRLPRVRRSSQISLFAVAAALEAWEGFEDRETIAPERIGLVFSTSDGGVIYTRKFFSAIAGSPDGVASPLLFPETVYNAPASHVAAILGIEGISTTVVGDATTGITALETGELMLLSDQADAVLVVAAEETDWILSQAYALWGISAVEENPHHGVIFGEGGAAVVLARGGSGPLLDGISTRPYRHASRAHEGLSEALRLAGVRSGSVHFGGASGRRFQRSEARALRDVAVTPDRSYLPKRFIGDSLAVGTLTCVALAAHEVSGKRANSACVTSIGFTGQAGAVSIC